MSYNIDVYFAGEPFPKKEYESFVRKSLSIRGHWEYGEEVALHLTGPGELHAYRVEYTKDADPDDLAKQFFLRVSLRRNLAPHYKPELGRCAYWIDVDSGGGTSAIHTALLFLIPALAFDCFTDAIVVDDESSKPENVEVYRNRDEFLRHAARTLHHWPNSSSWLGQVLDPQGNFIT